MPDFISLMGPDVSIEYEGKKYNFGALTFKDMAEYVLWYQYKEVEEAEITTQKLPKNIREKILEETYERCRNKRWVVKDENTGEVVKENFISWETPEVQKSTNTIEGIREQCYLSLRVNHPEITKELADKICTPVTMGKILDKILQVQGLASEKVLTAGETLPGE